MGAWCRSVIPREGRCRRVWGSGFGVEGRGSRVQGSGFRVKGEGSWLKVEGRQLTQRGCLVHRPHLYKGVFGPKWQKFVTFTEGNPLCPYGIAYDRVYELSNSGLFKKFL